MDLFESYTTTLRAQTHSNSPVAQEVTAQLSTRTPFAATLHDTFITFLSFVKTHNIPIIPVTKSDVRSVLGQGTAFLVNGAELPRTYVDPVSGTIFPLGMTVAMKRAKIKQDMENPVADRLRVIFNEMLALSHAPLSTHPNIVRFLGISFDIKGLIDSQIAIPMLILECAELGNLAEALETATKEDRPLSFNEKISLCCDVAHGLEVLHACGRIYCKLSDFGVSRYPNGKVWIGGSRPWQAPECQRGEFFELEDAKRADIYSFGMLIWRVFLDGDPFNLLEDFECQSAKERRERRNDAVAKIKDADQLVQHVCTSLALSAKFSSLQLEILYEVVNITLTKDRFQREVDIPRIIRLLTSDNLYQSRHSMAPKSLLANVETQLFDLEKWYSEIESFSPVVHRDVTSGFQDYAEGHINSKDANHGEKRNAAAYQLAICYANGFGVSCQPEECLKWLAFAAERGLQRASDALSSLIKAFNMPSQASSDTAEKFPKHCSMTGGSLAPEVTKEKTALIHVTRKYEETLTDGAKSIDRNLLSASKGCRYDELDVLLMASAKLEVSEDGVSPIHFLPYWSLQKAEALGRRLILAGADIDVQAKRGATISGTPLMWSVYVGRPEHSAILIRLGADTVKLTDNGDNALSCAARLHQASHLKLLLQKTPHAKARDQIGRLIEAAAIGESRFTRMKRHGENWQSAVIETLEVLKNWQSLLSDSTDFKTLVLSALRRSLKSVYGRMNSDIQVNIIEKTAIQPMDLIEILRDSVLTFNVKLFTYILGCGVRINNVDQQKKSLLHLCTKIPDHGLAATKFALPLLIQGAEIDKQDEDGNSPWMCAVLERKWYLADILLEKGADPLAINNEGFNVLGLCIKAVNLGSIKYLLKYCVRGKQLSQKYFLVNKDKNISALQLAAALSQPRNHGMKLEVINMFLIILKNLAIDLWQLNFRSNGVLFNASALDIASSLGNIHAVKYLVKRGAHALLENRVSALALTDVKLSETTDYLQRKNLERCAFIVKNWENDTSQARKLADDWTSMRTIDESHVKSSWEPVVFDYYSRKGDGKVSDLTNYLSRNQSENTSSLT